MDVIKFIIFIFILKTSTSEFLHCNLNYSVLLAYPNSSAPFTEVSKQSVAAAAGDTDFRVFLETPIIEEANSAVLLKTSIPTDPSAHELFMYECMNNDEVLRMTNSMAPIVKFDSCCELKTKNIFTISKYLFKIKTLDCTDTLSGYLKKSEKKLPLPQTATIMMNLLDGFDYLVNRFLRGDYIYKFNSANIAMCGYEQLFTNFTYSNFKRIANKGVGSQHLAAALKINLEEIVGILNEVKDRTMVGLEAHQNSDSYRVRKNKLGFIIQSILTWNYHVFKIKNDWASNVTGVKTKLLSLVDDYHKAAGNII